MAMPIYREQRHFLTPEDSDIVLQELLALVARATAQIRISIYGYTLPQLTQALIARHVAGVDVQLLFDHTQACGPTEKAQIALIKAAGIPYWIGTSPEHQIRHSKTLIVDGEWVENGSLNYSPTAFRQNNTVCVQRDRELAQAYLADWNANRTWIIANDASMNPIEASMNPAEAGS
jgi:phosphatidylserine/phosphatidylglycerophosphate/cardiolipin synthase-like enzyme